jgi:3-phenylpropionate/cinnamic acid dioxygenase small subunit
MVTQSTTDLGLINEVQQALYFEAELLDKRRYHEWMDMLADDIHYWMPLMRTVISRDSARLEIADAQAQSYFDDDKDMLKQRVAKLDTGFSWSEDPPSRTRHLVTNIQLKEVRDASAGLEVDIECYFFVYRTRLDSDTDYWVGRREEMLRKTDGQWKLAKRHIFLDQVVLQSKNISNFL